MEVDMAANWSNEENAFVPFTKAERIAQLADIDQSIVSLLRSAGTAIQCLSNQPPEADTSMNDAGDENNDDEDEDDEEEENDDDDMDERAKAANEAVKNSPQVKLFESSMKDFLRTLRSVNVRMKRQIWGLEEAGIISLTNKPDGENNAGDALKKLGPDGTGKIGGLDAGWLNSRSNKVERDLEGQLFDEVEKLYRGMLEKEGAGSS